MVKLQEGKFFEYHLGTFKITFVFKARYRNYCGYIREHSQRQFTNLYFPILILLFFRQATGPYALAIEQWEQCSVSL